MQHETKTWEQNIRSEILLPNRLGQGSRILMRQLILLEGSSTVYTSVMSKIMYIA
jgi:hypothetical protein